ncbi:bifunctional adenosylcobinamide kinase/adenosylcobinamide-phosphate guanylyltransferase [Oscillatoriales cyanobacterium LEGE 11467]|uniref:Adenosylcobinamide kinase n=1 Tax=Zarconia navalis LEGE 11467 TaxID=1828826 RepID=A0A928W146_9CYAN|nr:bifunctional adenosylcobinamide kinase/adenosylcobinamide-phosphate guanylyltransferase [Zarconia navalis]MBE9041355.1 bifunctional adenosylcobinamide kinase/adenosylcobinamide-phosphate guanylyltransferase [Zarconia navalis LEGE 11467]
MSRAILVTGPARSGKSEWAETLAEGMSLPVTYIATAQRNPEDVEWQQRIETHRQRRPTHWQTLEVPIDLAAIVRSASARHCLLVDSLGTWIANFLDRDGETWEKTEAEFLASLTQTAANVILVAEETGWGVIPAYPIGRTFRDRLGTLVRRVGAISNPVYLVAGGHVLNLSALGSPIHIDRGKLAQSERTMDR